MNIDWEKWMAEHHIRIGGKSHDNRSDEVCAGGGIPGTKMETEVPDNAGASGGSHIQKSE